MLYYVISFTIGFLISLSIFILINKHTNKKQKVGYIKVNLDDIDTNELQIHFTDANKLFNGKKRVIFDVIYVREGMKFNREKK